MLKFRAFPDIEGNVIESRLLLPQGTPLVRTEAVVDRLVAAIREVGEEYAPDQPDGRSLVRNIGVRFSVNQDAYESGAHLATVIVDVLPSEVRNARLDDVLNRWRGKVGSIPDVVSLKFTEPILGPAGRPVDIRLVGRNLADLKAASTELVTWLRGFPGVFDLSDDLRPGKPEVRLRLREGALALGLSASRVAGQLRAAFHGRTAAQIRVGPEDYEVDIRLSALDRDSLADLAYFTITLPDGDQVPLNAVAILDTGRGFGRIHRIDGRRAVTIQGDLDPNLANAGEIIAETRARLLPDLQARYPDMAVELEGEAREAAETGASLQRNLLIGLVAVFLLLSFQFRSYVEPVVVMAAIPLGLVGVVAGHLALGLDLSMPSMVGFASLAGVVVNNSILLVAFIKIHRRHGENAAAAARRAARQRFRAILLTSLTTVAGVLPLLTETSLQAQVLMPLVTSLAFGLFAATFQALFLVPALYAILDDFGLTARWKRPRPLQPPEPGHRQAGDQAGGDQRQTVGHQGRGEADGGGQGAHLQVTQGCRADGDDPGAHGPAAQVVGHAHLHHALGQHVRGGGHARDQKQHRHRRPGLPRDGQQQQAQAEGGDDPDVGLAAPAGRVEDGQQKAARDPTHGPRRVEDAETFGAHAQPRRRQFRQGGHERETEHLDRSGEHDEYRQHPVEAQFGQELAEVPAHGRPHRGGRLARCPQAAEDDPGGGVQARKREQRAPRPQSFRGDAGEQGPRQGADREARFSRPMAETTCSPPAMS